MKPIDWLRRALRGFRGDSPYVEVLYVAPGTDATPVIQAAIDYSIDPAMYDPDSNAIKRNTFTQHKRD